MTDIAALRKKQPARAGNGFDDIVQGFLALVMAKLLARERLDLRPGELRRH